MAPSTPPQRPHVDYTNQPLDVGDHVAFITTDPLSGKPRLYTGRIALLGRTQVCLEFGGLRVHTGDLFQASGDKPERVYHEDLYRLPETEQGADD